MTMSIGTVVLYRVGRNLNRAYRTCEFFGVSRLELCRCDGTLAGNLFSARDRVQVSERPDLPTTPNVIWLETDGDVDICDVDWRGVDTIVLGGETHDLRRMAHRPRVRIGGVGSGLGLTVEAALAIALHHARLPPLAA